MKDGRFLPFFLFFSYSLALPKLLFWNLLYIVPLCSPLTQPWYTFGIFFFVSGMLLSISKLKLTVATFHSKYRYYIKILIRLRRNDIDISVIFFFIITLNLPIFDWVMTSQLSLRCLLGMFAQNIWNNILMCDHHVSMRYWEILHQWHIAAVITKRMRVNLAVCLLCLAVNREYVSVLH